MPIVSDDGVYETEFEAVLHALPLPPELKRVYITREDPEVVKPADPGDNMVVSPEAFTRGQELDQFEQDPTTGTGIEIDWKRLNQPFGELKSTSKEDTPVVATAAGGIKITEGDINEAINVGMSAGPASIEKKILSKNYVTDYVNSFIKQPEFKSPPPDKFAGLNEFDKALAQISEALGDTKYTDEIIAQSVAKQIKAKKAEPKVDPFEQIPFGYTDEQWAKLLPIEKKEVLAFAEKGEPMTIGPKPGTKEFDTYYGFDMPKESPIPEGWGYVEGMGTTTTPKLTAKELEEVTRNRLMAEMTEVEAQFQKVDAKAAAEGYTTPGFRGIHLHAGSDVNPVHNFDKSQYLYSSESPLLADMYASYLSTHPGYKIAEGAFGEGASVAPVYLNTSQYHVADAKGAMWSTFNKKAIAEALKKGKVGVVIKNVRDEPNSTEALRNAKTIYITFPEGASTIKSRFAEKFDPKDPNMLKMIPAIAVGGAAGYVAVQAEKDDKS